MELHREFSFPRNSNPDVEDQGSENSEELHASCDIEKEAPISSSHLSSVSEDATLKETELAGIVDDKSFELYLDEHVGPLHVPIDD
jgi:hypothetical protein